MSYTRLFRLGTSTFPIGTSVAKINKGRTIGSAKLARAHGNVQTIGYHNGVEIELRVPICRGPLDESAVRAREEEVREILDQGPASLYLHDDRYWRCVECRDEPTVISETGFDRLHSIGVTLLGPDDNLFAAETTTETWTPSNGVAHAMVISGNALAYPTIELTVGGSGLETIAFTVSNTYTYRGEEKEEEFTLSGDVTAGDVIVVRTLPRPYVKIGAIDYMSLLEGLFPRMFAGVNDWVLSWTSATIASATVRVQERWLTP